MRATDITRKVDDLGRIVIPVEVRRQLGIQTADGLEILVNGSDLVLQKWHPGCVFCGITGGLQKYRGKWVCPECVRLLGAVGP